MGQIDRLLSAFIPNANTEPHETLRRYLEAIDGIVFADIEAAVDDFVKAKVPGQNTRFAPTPPELAGHCRRLADRRHAEHDARIKATRQIESRSTDVLVSPEARDRAMALVRGAVQRLDDLAGRGLKLNENASELMAKTNARFEPDMSPDAVAWRLMKRRPQYTAGDPDGEDEGDMGDTR